MVKPLVIVALAALTVACAHTQQGGGSREERAKAVALAYVARHRIPLPQEWRIEVEDGACRSDFAPPEHFYWVHVQMPRRGTFETVYDIWVDSRSWKIRLFTDRRTMVPSRV